jgi:hypothetical protein
MLRAILVEIDRRAYSRAPRTGAGGGGGEELGDGDDVGMVPSLAAKEIDCTQHTLRAVWHAPFQPSSNALYECAATGHEPVPAPC